MSDREATAELANIYIDTLNRGHGVITRFEQGNRAAEAILAAGYRKAERATEFGTIFNRAAVFLNPPAESLEEFRERYESEFGWMLTERDPILTRTFLRCNPEPSEPTLHAEAAL